MSPEKTLSQKLMDLLRLPIEIQLDTISAPAEKSLRGSSAIDRYFGQVFLMNNRKLLKLDLLDVESEGGSHAWKNRVASNCSNLRKMQHDLLR